MTFDITKAYYAVLKFVESIEDIPEGPTRNIPIFKLICDELNITKKNRDKFRVNLYFAWKHNTNDFTQKIHRALLNRRKNDRS